MYPISIPSDNLLAALGDLDRRAALAIQRGGCTGCGGPLHFATWTRKPRGADVPDDLTTRWGLCCGHCRKRRLPPSSLFAGRRVYLKAVLLVAVAARQRDRERPTLRKLTDLFGMAADTVRRWLRAFLDGLAGHPDWRAHRGRIPPVVRDSQVPGALLDLLLDTHGVDGAAFLTARWVPAL